MFTCLYIHKFLKGYQIVLKVVNKMKYSLKIKVLIYKINLDIMKWRNNNLFLIVQNFKLSNVNSPI